MKYTKKVYNFKSLYSLLEINLYGIPYMLQEASFYNFL